MDNPLIKSPPTAAEITIPQLKSYLSLYTPLIQEISQKAARKSDHALPSLDHLRYITLPAKVQRQQHLTLPDLKEAMEWKLTHGTSRPTLRALIASNSPSFVEEVSRDAFAMWHADSRVYLRPLKKLAELKGVGPATASLLLGIYDDCGGGADEGVVGMGEDGGSGRVPFMGDEFFRWVCWDERSGWARAMKYDWKEYGMLWEGVTSVRERLNGAKGDLEGEVKAVELEKVAYVLGKMATVDWVREWITGKLAEDSVKGDADSNPQEGRGEEVGKGSGATEEKLEADEAGIVHAERAIKDSKPSWQRNPRPGNSSRKPAPRENTRMTRSSTKAAQPVMISNDSVPPKKRLRKS
ncbi:hypothetical protein MMC25_007017 [Agyrium rufum]|nr:hypothetical protein [Agyrium rufum]